MDQFYKTISSLDSFTAPLLLNDLLGEEEQIMLAKRLGAIILCIRGSSAYHIWTTLKISPTTAQKIYDNFTDGHYKNFERVYKKNELSFVDFLQTLETVLNCGFSPRGKGRWKRVTKLLTEK